MHDFDFIDVVQRKTGKIDGATGLIERRSIDQHFRVIRISAVEKQRGKSALGPGARDTDAGLLGQQVGIALLVMLMSLAFYNDISRHLN